MAINDQQIKTFFDGYQARLMGGLSDPPAVDAEASAAAFADWSMEASPKGVFSMKNDDKFRAGMEKGMEYYRSLGTKAMKITALESTSLDDFHAMAKVHWQAFYQKKDGSEIVVDFDVIYFLQDVGQGLKIFAFITGDEEKLYEDLGLKPE